MKQEKKKKKKKWLMGQIRPAPIQVGGYAGWIFFLWVENINPPRQKMLVMQVDPAGSTHFSISIINKQTRT